MVHVMVIGTGYKGYLINLSFNWSTDQNVRLIRNEWYM
jgi:hypothetical protein